MGCIHLEHLFPKIGVLLEALALEVARDFGLLWEATHAVGVRVGGADGRDADGFVHLDHAWGCAVKAQVVGDQLKVLL